MIYKNLLQCNMRAAVRSPLEVLSQGPVEGLPGMGKQGSTSMDPSTFLSGSGARGGRGREGGRLVERVRAGASGGGDAKGKEVGQSCGALCDGVVGSSLAPPEVNHLSNERASKAEKQYLSKLSSNTLRYKSRYPNETLNDLTLNLNLRFYLNQIKSVPDGDFIEDILSGHGKWARNYARLEAHHAYVQWLFPIHEKGVNPKAQVLQRHEAAAMQANPQIMLRIQRSYCMMLDFYGARMVNKDTGQLERTEVSS